MTCYNCLNRPFKKQICATCEGHHKTRECISNEAWKIDNTHVKVSCWADDIGHMCEECRQQQLMIRSGNTKVLFKSFIHWLLGDKLNGFTLVAHNGAGFKRPNLKRDFSLTSLISRNIGTMWASFPTFLSTLLMK